MKISALVPEVRLLLEAAGGSAGFSDRAVVGALREAFDEGKGGVVAGDDPETAAPLMAEILYGLFGDDALSLLAGDDGGQVQESRRLLESWDKLAHPRGKDGRFIPKGSGEAGAAAKKAIGDVLSGKKTAAAAKDVAEHLAILSVKQLRELHQLHGKAIPGKLRQQLVDGVLTRLTGEESPAKPLKKSGAKKPAKDAVKKPSPATIAPAPPKPGFTGRDSLGREWRDGELVPGEAHPPDLSGTAPAAKVATGRPTPVKAIFGEDVPLTPEQAADFQALGMGRVGGGHTYRPDLNLYNVSKNPEAAKRLVDAGLMEAAYGGGGRRLTDKGARALMGSLPDDAPAPTTLKSIEKTASLYGLASAKQREELCKHFGIAVADPDRYDSYTFRHDLKEGASRLHNPEHVAVKIRKAKDVHEFVAGLSHLKIDDERDRLREREQGLEGRARAITAEVGGEQSLASLDYSLMSLKAKLSYRGTKDKKKLRAALAELEGIKAERDEIWEAKRKAVDASFAAKQDAVSSRLRARAKDPGKVVCGHSPDVPPESRRAMDRGVQLLAGVVQKYEGGKELPEFTTYKDGEDKRAHCQTESGRVNFNGETRPSVAIHEMLHGIEANDPGTAAACYEFLKYRVKDEKPIDMLEKFGGRYDPGERGRKDHFEEAMGDENSAYYAGKDYGRGLGHTEILTMGVQKLYEDPQGFAARDPEYAAFCVGILDGTFRLKPIPEE